MSLRVLPGGRVVGGSVTALGTGITSEQSMRSLGLCPVVARRFMTFSNLVTIDVWSAVQVLDNQAAVMWYVKKARTNEGLPLASRAVRITRACQCTVKTGMQRLSYRGSRAISLSENRRNSPAIGDSTSPTLEPFPGNRVPATRVCGCSVKEVHVGHSANHLPRRRTEHRKSRRSNRKVCPVENASVPALH